MRTLGLAALELKRFTHGRLLRISLAVAVLVPLLYGALYLWAFWDPYSRLDRVPAALVVEDRTVDVDGTPLHVGADLATTLQDRHVFDWHVVDAADAQRGVEAGDYYLALTIPADFSARLASPATADPEQAMLRLTTNDATNYLAGTIGRSALTEVRASVAAQAGATMVDRILVGLDSAHDGLATAADGAGTLASGSATAAAGSHRLAAGAASAQQGAAALSSGLGTLADRTGSLPAQTRALADGAAQVASGNQQLATEAHKVAAVTGRLAAQQEQMLATLDAYAAAHPDDAFVAALAAKAHAAAATTTAAQQKVDSTVGSIDRLAAGSQQVADGTRRLAASTPALTDGIAQAADGAASLDGGLVRLADGAVALDGGVQKVADGASSLAGGLASGAEKVPSLDAAQRSDVATVVSDPVGLARDAQNRAATYGAGFAPYFLPLALWVGGLVAYMLLRPLSPRALARDAAPLRTTVAGLLPAGVLVLGQVALLVAVVEGLVGLDPVQPLGFWAFATLSGLVFAAILQLVNAALGTAGRVVALVLLMLQLTSAGGTYPIETSPAFFQALHPWMPMTYVVRGLRTLVSGGDMSVVWSSSLVLLAFGLGAVALTTAVAARRRTWSLSRLSPEVAL
ncbi:MAG: YhgE/Pip domain-containing protein [Candidatus Nanopelagicales bacterium]